MSERERSRVRARRARFLAVLRLSMLLRRYNPRPDEGERFSSPRNETGERTDRGARSARTRTETGTPREGLAEHVYIGLHT